MADAGKPFQCLHCERAFQTKGALQAHCAHFHPDASPASRATQEAQWEPVGCRHCNCIFKNRSRLHRHCNRAHIGACKEPRTVNKPVGCWICNCVFASLSSLESHDRALHPNGKRMPGKVSVPVWLCPICETRFQNNVDLQRHQRSKNHCFCGSCAIYFASIDSANKHFRKVVHASHFHCCDCSKDFPNEQAMIQHLEDKNHTRLPC